MIFFIFNIFSYYYEFYPYISMKPKIVPDKIGLLNIYLDLTKNLNILL